MQSHDPEFVNIFTELKHIIKIFRDEIAIVEQKDVDKQNAMVLEKFSLLENYISDDRSSYIPWVQDQSEQEEMGGMPQKDMLGMSQRQNNDNWHYILANPEESEIISETIMHHYFECGRQMIFGKTVKTVHELNEKLRHLRIKKKMITLPMVYCPELIRFLNSYLAMGMKKRYRAI